ncbi:hypothetical protein HEK616_75080 (plasmid) [Streptomyces nigrescens]|uniref:LPXTG cell wall anchor domain-containing protein n=2 Tax=Streptomyces TaxID=1883 RepID=A0ABN6RAX1_STRNI|nr:hypothetical protein [Streptomyces nigrescens]MEE4419249.1 hypothetical protein [Streptomyces sp. DSM 41528]BDM74021.1 hypothetical protein HEK616_75080 [Streptomyces nigrescens]
MRSISAFCGVVVVGGALALSSPAVHAETAKGSCSGAMSAAKKAKSSYDSYDRELRDLTNQGGHPDRSQRDHLGRLKMKWNDASSMADRTCGKSKPAKPRPKAMPKSMPKAMPHGKVKAGAGAMSAPSGPSDLALTSSAALISGAAGVWLLRRRDDEELG